MELSTAVDQLDIVINPTSENDDVAHASRCALRTYASNMKNRHPDLANQIYDYVKKLDQDDMEQIKKRAISNTKKKTELVTQSILYLLLNTEIDMTITLLKHILRKAGDNSGAQFVDYCVSNLIKNNTVTVSNNIIKLV